MYIHKIKLTNIRGFKSLDFDLQRPDESYAGWTVFTGDNGSGKSTLLKSIALGLTGRDTARSLQPSFNRWVRHDAPEHTGHVELEIVRVNGFTGDVNFDVITDSPGNYTVEFFPANRMQVTVGPNVPLGDHVLIIRGFSGGQMRTTLMTLQVVP